MKGRWPSGGQPVTVFWGAGLIQTWGWWNCQSKRLYWEAPRGVEPLNPVTGCRLRPEPFALYVETPGHERGRTWAWGWRGPEARALKATLALERA